MIVSRLFFLLIMNASAHYISICLYPSNRNLKKNLRPDIMHDVTSVDGLECKVCLTTYRLFYVEDTEDFLYRNGAHQSRVDYKASDSRKKKFRQWLSERVVPSENGIVLEASSPVAQPVTETPASSASSPSNVTEGEKDDEENDEDKEGQ